jgi:hypothetical protein
MTDIPGVGPEVTSGREISTSQLKREDVMANHGSVQIGVKEGITSDQLKVALDRVLKELGCPACGLVGLDLRIRPDLGLAHTIGNLPGVVNVSHFSVR